MQSCYRADMRTVNVTLLVTRLVTVTPDRSVGLGVARGPVAD